MDRCTAQQAKFKDACLSGLNPAKALGLIKNGVRSLCFSVQGESQGQLYLGKLREFQQSVGSQDSGLATVAGVKAQSVTETAADIADLETKGNELKSSSGFALVLTGNTDLKKAGSEMKLKAKELRESAAALAKVKESLGDSPNAAILDAAIAALKQQSDEKEKLAAAFESDGRNIVERISCAIGFC